MVLEFNAFTILVIAFVIVTFASLATQKHKLIVCFAGFLGFSIGFALEAVGINTTETWYWEDSGGGLLGVPYIVIVTYTMAGFVGGIFWVSPVMQKLVNRTGDYYFIPFLSLGLIYGIWARDMFFFVTVMCLWAYRVASKDQMPILKLALFFPAVDIVSENWLIHMGHLNYPCPYDAAIYMGTWVAGVGLMSATKLLVDWKEKRQGKGSHHSEGAKNKPDEDNGHRPAEEEKTQKKRRKRGE